MTTDRNSSSVVALKICWPRFRGLAWSRSFLQSWSLIHVWRGLKKSKRGTEHYGGVCIFHPQTLYPLFVWTGHWYVNVIRTCLRQNGSKMLFAENKELLFRLNASPLSPLFWSNVNVSLTLRAENTIWGLWCRVLGSGIFKYWRG